MAALRRRKPEQQSAPVRKQPLAAQVPVPSTGVESGWQSPKKIARRGVAGQQASSLEQQRSGEGGTGDSGSLPSSSNVLKSASSLQPPPGTVPSACRLGTNVPVDSGRGGSQQPASEALKPDTLKLVEFGDHANPFTSLGSDRWAGRPKSSSVSHSSPSKRIRPGEPLAQRIVSKSGKGKGKAPLLSHGSLPDSFAFSASTVTPRGSDVPPGSGMRKSRRKDGLVLGKALGSTQPVQEVVDLHEAAVCLLQKAIDRDVADVTMDSSREDTCSSLGPVDPPLMTSDPADVELSGDMDVVPPSLISE